MNLNLNLLHTNINITSQDHIRQNIIANIDTSNDMLTLKNLVRNKETSTKYLCNMNWSVAVNTGKSSHR